MHPAPAQTADPSAYEMFEREDAAHFGLDGYGTPASRQLRDHLATGGSMVEYLGFDAERSRIGGLLFAAFLDCLTEKRGYCPIPRPAPETPSQCMRRLIAEANHSASEAA